MLPRLSIFRSILRIRQKSIARAMLLAVSAPLLSMRLAGFPAVHELHGTNWQIVSVLIACWALAESARCLGRRWSFYHVGVLLLLYSDLMILAMTLFLWLYL